MSASEHAQRSTNPNWLRTLDSALASVDTLAQVGHIDSVSGAIIRARGVFAAIGELCELRELQGSAVSSLGFAEVIGLQGEDLLLCSLAPTLALSRRVQVVALGRRLTVPVGAALLGRVLDGMGRPIDGLALPAQLLETTVDASAPDPMQRPSIKEPLVSGIRSIDGLLSAGVGQRIAIFSPAGGGKSTLLGALARQCRADVVVLALVGERGREVGDFVSEQLGLAQMRRSVVLAATSDRPPIERIKCAQAATAIAEYFRAQGQHVLLLVYSLTRLARAQRELSLAMGEPPAREGFPASVFSLLPTLLERAGPSKEGAISAFYTVLTDDDRGQDVIAEEVRSIVDGHLVLSRRLGGAGHFPAIDVLRSTSRLMPRVASARHLALAQQLRGLLSKLDDIELLLQVGEYRSGSDPLADRAIALRPAIEQFLRQPSLRCAREDDPTPADLAHIERTLEALLAG